MTWAAWTSCFPEGIQGCLVQNYLWGNLPRVSSPAGLWMREGPAAMALCLELCCPSPSLTPIFQMRKLWHREVRSLAQSHGTGEK